MAKVKKEQEKYDSKIESGHAENNAKGTKSIIIRMRMGIITILNATTTMIPYML